jgi:hypothetical protein
MHFYCVDRDEVRFGDGLADGIFVACVKDMQQ